MIGRLLVIEQLADRQDKESVAKLKQALNEDAFYGVRVEASRALRQIHTDEARDALLASTAQSDARVRRAVVADIAGFYAEPVLASALSTLKREKNPDIQAAALRGLGGYAGTNAREALLTFLTKPSFHNELAEAAISGIRLQDDPTYIPSLLGVLSTNRKAFTARGFAQGLDTLAWISRNEDKKDAVRAFLVSYVNDPRDRIQIGAISALGVLGDPAALSVVQRFAEASRGIPEQRAAEKAVAALREGRKPADDFKNLRQEVLSLQKADREMRKELDDLKKSMAARQTNAPAGKKSTAPLKSKP
jgi:aminopeptidase N